MFINGMSVGIGLLFLSMLYLNPTQPKPSKLPAGVIVILIWLLLGPILMEQGSFLARLHIASVPVVFFLLLPLLYWYQEGMTAHGAQPLPKKRPIHWVPLGPATLLSLSIGLMPTEDFNAMFFNDSDQLSLWVNINAAGFALLLVSWTVLSIFYLSKIVKNTKAYHQKLYHEFSNHEGKRLDWLVGFTALLVLTWFYALVVLGASSEVSTPFISETALSVMVLLLIWMFCIQTLNRRPAFYNAIP